MLHGNNAPGVKGANTSLPGSDTPPSVSTGPRTPTPLPSDLGDPKALAELADAVAKGAEFFHTPNGEPWVAVGHRSLPIRSDQFRGWLGQQWFRHHSTILKEYHRKDVIAHFEAKARYEGAKHELHLRVGDTEDAYWISLGRPDGKAVRIDEEGWSVVDAADVPIKFWQPPQMNALPLPDEAHGDVSLLREFCNVGSDDEFRLLLAWMTMALSSDGPYPVLVINGGQGSAKSTLAQVARKIVDPNAVPLLGRPNSERDLIAIAKGNHILAFDNLSGVNAAFADEICRLATGGGLGGRQLYTDADLAMFDAQRPVILNGIPDLANRGDLADRSICLSLPTIPPSQRKLEKAMWSRFETALPVIFAGLLDAMVEGLRRWEMLEARADAGEIELPRMADFALWGMAVAPAFGWTEDDFLAAYARNRSDSEQHVVEASALAESLIDLLKVRGEFTGTATQLLIEIRKRHPSAVFRQALPKSPQSVGTELRRLEPALATMGIEMELGVREGGTGRRINHIRQVD